jgi:transcriptional regulator with XRE-family HTH domain
VTAQAFLPFPNSTHEAGLYDQARARWLDLRGGRSQSEMARMLGISQQVISRFEHGADPSLAFLILLGMRGVRLDWLFFGEGRCTRTPPHLGDFEHWSPLDFELWEVVAL